MSKQKLECRRVGVDEIPACSKVVFDAFNAMAENSGSPAIPEVGIVSDRLTEYANDTGIPGLLYGGYTGGELCAFMMLRKLGIDEEAWEISMLSVAPGHQGEGFAGDMVEFALGEILAFKGVLAVCAVTEGNDRALELFARHGFESEASGVPVGGGMNIWMLRRDMHNKMAADAAKAEAEADAAREAEELSGLRVSCDSCQSAGTAECGSCPSRVTGNCGEKNA